MPWAFKQGDLIQRYVGLKVIDEPVAGTIEAALRLANGDYQCLQAICLDRRVS